MGVPLGILPHVLGLALVTPPTRSYHRAPSMPGLEKTFLTPRPVQSKHHNNSCNLIPLIVRNLASWTFVCPERNLVHPATGNNGRIDLRYIADPLKAISSLRLVPYPWGILKIRQLSSLVYRPRHGVLPKVILLVTFIDLAKKNFL